jgi:radical SAM superfamily enzyme YgiQ (UPF0313 family)
MKVLFIHPPWGDIYGKFKSAARVGNRYPPLGICYLSSVLKKGGHTTKIVDAEIESKNINDIIFDINKFKPDLIGFTSTTPLFSATKKMAERMKMRMDIPIVIGGPHVTVLPDGIITSDGPFDFAICGEGEGPMLKLVNCLSNDKNTLNEIKGLIYKDRNGKVVRNMLISHIKEIDTIPWPDRESLMLDRYNWGVPGRGIKRFTTLMTDRGCPFSCTFCSAHTVMGKKMRYRNITDVVDEIDYLVNKLKITHISFVDDTLTLNRTRVIQMCQEVIKRKISFTWEGWTRANTIDDELVQMMRRAGFVRVSFGIESGSEKILEKIKKGVKLNDIVSGYRIMKKYGVETRGSVMLGHPYETRETINETLQFIKDLKDCDQMYINIATPYPGTKLYHQAITGEGGLMLLERDFSKYSRYGNAVISVNDLSPEDLVKLQRKGFIMFYFTPSRIWYNYKRAGLKVFFKNSIAFARSVILKV